MHNRFSHFWLVFCVIAIALVGGSTGAFATDYSNFFTGPCTVSVNNTGNSRTGSGSISLGGYVAGHWSMPPISPFNSDGIDFTAGTSLYYQNSPITCTLVDTTHFTMTVPAWGNAPIYFTWASGSKFRANSVSLTLAVTGNGSTTPAVGTTTFTSGTTVAISATASPGYVFTGWSGDFAGQPQSFTWTASGNASATANFTAYTAPTCAVNVIGVAPAGANHMLIVACGAHSLSSMNIVDSNPASMEISISSAVDVSKSGHMSFNISDWTDVGGVPITARVTGFVKNPTVVPTLSVTPTVFPVAGGAVIITVTWPTPATTSTPSPTPSPFPTPTPKSSTASQISGSSSIAGMLISGTTQTTFLTGTDSNGMTVYQSGTNGSATKIPTATAGNGVTNGSLAEANKSLGEDIKKGLADDMQGYADGAQGGADDVVNNLQNNNQGLGNAKGLYGSADFNEDSSDGNLDRTFVMGNHSYSFTMDPRSNPAVANMLTNFRNLVVKFITILFAGWVMKEIFSFQVAASSANQTIGLSGGIAGGAISGPVGTVFALIFTTAFASGISIMSAYLSTDDLFTIAFSANSSAAGFGVAFNLFCFVFPFGHFLATVVNWAIVMITKNTIFGVYTTLKIWACGG